jgi:cation:H+ antiporter
MFGGFMYYVYKQMRAEQEHSISTSDVKMSNWKISLLIAIGLAALILGGKLVVDNAVSIATELGISEKIIGLTIVAIGTSLPELVTSVVAAIKKKSDIAFGNIIGSNIFNILLVLPLSALISPVNYNISFNIEMFILTGGTLFLFVAMFTGGKRKLDRWESALLLTTYFLYTGFIIVNEI